MLINKNNITTFLFLLFCAVILFLSVRGLPGNPTSGQMDSSVWKENGPFELSPERGRFALLYSVVEDHSFQFSRSLAKFAMPDIALSREGYYVSMFAPGASFLALSGYLLGKHFGLAQVGAFASIALFALFNIVLIRLIAIKLGAHYTAANLGALAFAFATPAFAYATTFYQHHISTFFVLFSLYLILKWRNWQSLVLVWSFVAFSIVVDSPNFFIMLPIALYALRSVITVKERQEGLEFSVKPRRSLTLAAMIIPFAFLLWFNQVSHGSPLQLSGTLPNAIVSDQNSGGKPDLEKTYLMSSFEKNSELEKSAFGFFNTRNLLNGFYIHIFSSDRGIVWYAPIIILGVLGIALLYREKEHVVFANVIVAVIGINFLIYSMWGDPYGGWAFGSRYLIPAYGLLAIGIAIVLNDLRKNYAFISIVFLVLAYSVSVNTLGAVTTNANPPQIEVLALEKITGKVEKYTYDRNWDYLNAQGSKSFVFQAYAKNFVTARQFYELIAGFLIIISVFLLFELVSSAKKEKI